MKVNDISCVDSVDSLGAYLDSLGYSITRVGEQYGLEVDPKEDLELPKTVRAPIRSLLLLADYDKSFQIYFAELEKLGRTQVRPLVESFYRKYPQAEYLFIFTTDFSEILFVSPQRITEVDAEKQRIRLRMLDVDPSTVYHTDLQVLRSIKLPLGLDDPSEIWKRHVEAFNVQSVTKAFFEDYKKVMDCIIDVLGKQKATKIEAKEFAQQLLNRLMLIYFLQRKGWLKMNGKPEKRYLRKLWFRYLDESSRRDMFYSNWLSVLYFNVFNGEGVESIDLPDDVLESFRTMPFLNGGLFKRYEYDEKDYRMPDSVFSLILGTEQEPGVLEKYNFTVREDTPLEVEVAVDPEMLGKVYESLVLEEEREGRRKAGIFYTPRTEVDFMCRQSIMEYLKHHTDLDYDALLSFLYGDEIPKTGFGRNVTEQIEQLLDRIKVVDPGCGSGAFLVGMMHVLEDLHGKLAKHCRDDEPDTFDLRNKIVRRNLYGADIKAWAIRVAELRLWLTLIVDAGEEVLSQKPVLPNLTFRLRIGDSLVQEVGGRPLSARAIFKRPSKRIVQLMKGLTSMKEEYYSRPGDRELEKNIMQREAEILLHAINLRIDELKRSRRKAAATQQKLTATQTALPKDEETLERIEKEIGELETLKGDVLESREHDFFFWEIDFAEVFFDGGFDIAIGNPPYVKQEEIAPLLEIPGLAVSKKEYKKKLFDNAHVLWGDNVRYEGRSDLYVYFYYQGMALLKEGGVLCLISSNSWLDVGYGGALQAFLLKNSTILGIFDNLSIRSFEDADINTIIVLARRSSDLESNSRNKARFVAFRIPWEDARSREVLWRIYQSNELRGRRIPSWKSEIRLESHEDSSLRLRLVSQRDLWLDGLEVRHEMRVTPFTGKYKMNKWGGRFIRAPDIFYTVLEKGKGKLIQLGEIADVRPGCYTGINDFFYLSRERSKELGMEQKLLKVILRSTDEVSEIMLDSSALKTTVFSCSLSKHELRSGNLEGALGYIEWGERQRTRKRQKTAAGIPWPKTETVKNRKPGWWAIPHQNLTPTDLFMLYVINDRFICPVSSNPIASDRCFHRVFLKEETSTKLMAAILNSTLAWFLVSVIGRTGLGQGAMKFEVADAKQLTIPNPSMIPAREKRNLTTIFNRIQGHEVRSVYEELGLPKPDKYYSNVGPSDVSSDKVVSYRRMLDAPVFRSLGLTEKEQEDVYRGVAELVKNRLAKARSV